MEEQQNLHYVLSDAAVVLIRINPSDRAKIIKINFLSSASMINQTLLIDEIRNCKLAASLDAQNDVDGAVDTDTVIGQSLTVFELLTLVDQALLIDRNLKLRVDVILDLRHRQVVAEVDADRVTLKGFHVDLTRSGCGAAGSSGGGGSGLRLLNVSDLHFIISV